ncbi:hypothetical protein N5U00_01465 [Aliarcobacter butzleri]|uniref:hypothetical protein n=1 Tax=Aliarcobacter butzleri TaxID=28197 RepID=UPI0021B60153|nr:hypothetical protein [Aliarcobacter butzleri]MCT7573983.1 hypothetical protein [Aliarcobacter butzleri]MCT7592159.1 hypothetical protein [Aliarcobacter butzleri]
MQKINISQNTIDNFYKQISEKFNNKDLSKIEKKKVKWSISLAELNSLISKKLKGFRENLDLEKLIKMEYSDLCKLVEYIKSNQLKTKLTIREKDIFLTLYSRLNNALFVKDLDVKVCPYCNRNYILNFQKKGKENATAQLDHFFDKKKYPYLAISIYNLVPSCGTCNQRKSTIEETIFYPYNESFNNSVKFSLKGIKSRDELIKENLDFFDEKRIELDYKILNNKDKVERHIEVFNIKNLYNEHKDIVSELLQKKVIYSDDYLESLLDEYEGTLFKNREDLLRLITGGYIDDTDINKRPLSKLIKDISEELDLI